MSLSFLFCKPWHPATTWNQKKIWEAEQKHAKRKKDEEVANKELARESDRIRYEHMAGGKGEPDPSSHSLNFMYAPPPGFQQPQPDELKDEDEEVKKFKALAKMKSDPNFSASAQASELEKLVGRRVNPGVSLAEQQERFPFLKNAPVEHEYAAGVKVNFKPFNNVVRHVKCMRCGEWGHRSGDRECRLINENPNDTERRIREDPMTYMNPRGGDGAGGGAVAAGLRGHYSASTGGGEEDGDPDTAFLKFLSSKEKRRLLRRLQEMEASEGKGEEDSSKRSRKRKKKRRDSKDRERVRKESSGSTSGSVTKSKDVGKGERKGRGRDDERGTSRAASSSALSKKARMEGKEEDVEGKVRRTTNDSVAPGSSDKSGVTRADSSAKVSRERGHDHGLEDRNSKRRRRNMEEQAAEEGENKKQGVDGRERGGGRRDEGDDKNRKHNRGDDEDDRVEERRTNGSKHRNHAESSTYKISSDDKRPRRDDAPNSKSRSRDDRDGDKREGKIGRDRRNGDVFSSGKGHKQEEAGAGRGGGSSSNKKQTGSRRHRDR